MAGLLDFLNTDEGRLGLGLLGAAAPSMEPQNFASRLAGGMSNYRGMQEQQQKKQMLDMQMDNYKSEIEARKLAGIKDARQQEMDARFMGLGGQGGQPGPQVPGGPSMSGHGGGQGGGFTAEAISKQFGIPLEVVMSDYRFNGGKKIAEIINDRSKPDWQVSNGYRYNKNDPNTQAGFMPFMNTSSNGQTSMGMPSADGGFNVSAPGGALETYGAYQNATNKSAANNKPQKVYNPATQREEYTTEGAIIDATKGGAPSGYQNEGQMRSATQGGMGADPAALQREIAQTSRDLMNPSLDAGSKRLLQGHLDDLRGQQQRIGSQPAQAPQAPQAQGGGFAAGPSASEAAQNKAAESGKVDATKAITTGLVKDSLEMVGLAKSAPEVVRNAQMIRAALDNGAITGTGADLRLSVSKALATAGLIGEGKAADSQALIAGLGRVTMAGIKTSGLGAGQGFTDNDKRFLEGSISGTIDSTPANLRRVADLSERVATASHQKGSVILGRWKQDPALKSYVDDVPLEALPPPAQTARGGGAAGAWSDKPKPPQPMKGMVRGGYKFNGGDPADKSNWERQ